MNKRTKIIMKKALWMTLLLFCMSGMASAALSSGYYRIKSNYYSGRYMGESTTAHTLYTTTEDISSDYSFLWNLNVSGSTVTIENAVTGRKVQRLYSKSVQYSTSAVATDYNFTLGESGSAYTFTDYNNCGLHCADSRDYIIVRWDTSADANKWILEPVTPDATELATQQAAARLSISSGYYRIYSNCYSDRYITEDPTNHRLLTQSSSTSLMQVWYLNIDGDGNTTLKNVLTDQYIQGLNTNSVQYSTSTSTSDNTFVIGETKGGSYNTYTFMDHGGAGLHCSESQSYNVVHWSTDAAASVWRLEAVATPTDEAIAAERDAIAEATNEQLTTFFTSTACTALKSPYSGYSDAALRSAMSALPTTAQNMAVKVKNNNWATYYDGWDKTERTFRIADYQAYSSSSRWTNLLFLDRTLGRLSNPTGIYVESGDYLQVYVGTIPTGQSVKLEVAGYEQGAGSTYDLHEGMNALRITASGNCFVFYEVDNTNNGAEPYTALSNYPDVTVHIEGGTVQGYFDRTKGDDDSDWAKMIDAGNALTNQYTFCMKSKTITFNVRTDLLKASVGTEMVRLLKIWQDIQDLEDVVMGRDLVGGADYAYCNNVHTLVTVSGSGRLYAGSYGVYFSSDVTGVYDPASLSTAGGIWAPLHELGHHRQRAVKMTGTTEMSNNLFSNVGIYEQGRVSSRCAGVNEILDGFLNHESWPERVAKANTSGTSDTYNSRCATIYWQLYLYFHIYKGQDDFFPTLFSLLRSDPMVIRGTDAFTLASEDYLRFYIKCCLASGYDLTEFFEAYGFFMLPPTQESKTLGDITSTTYQLIGDYQNSYLHVTQDMIDQAKLAVSALGYPKCDNMIFIEDRVKAPLATYEGHAEGETRPLYYGGSYGQVGDVGQYTDFDAPCYPYHYNINERGVVTMEGTGAVGYKVYDSSGNIVAFYNTNTFTLPSSAYDENGLKSGYTIKAAAGDGTVSTANLDTEIEIDEFPKTGTSYVLFTPFRGGRFLRSNGAGEGLVGTTTDIPIDAMKWQFVSRNGEENTFDIRNVSDNSYIDPTATNDTQVTTTLSKPATGWKISDASTSGMYILYTDAGAQLNQTNNGGTNGYKIYNWGGGGNTTDHGCQFCIQEVSDLSNTAMDQLAGYTINISTTAADNLETGRWYVMFDRGTTNGNHGYLYENGSNRLYNTETAPTDGTVTNAQAKYLVRLIDSGLSGKYYIQTGFGNYFYQFAQASNVPTTAYTSQPITVAKISDNNGHFYLQSYNNSVVLDANDLSYGDATVVGWGTAAPTDMNGNNDWAFYPIEEVYPVTLHPVGNASYATLYLNMDAQTAVDTKAYYITETSNGYAQLTPVSNEGRDIPAYTAVVLINSAAAASTNMTLTSGISPVISKNNNLLKGTLTSMTLDLSDASSYYSLGQKNSVIGFYKFQNGNTTTITLGANKAYLDTTSVSSGNVKGFLFDFEDANSIVSPLGETEKGASIYNLAGQRLTKPMKGINIIGGKKVIMR